MNKTIKYNLICFVALNFVFWTPTLLKALFGWDVMVGVYNPIMAVLFPALFAAATYISLNLETWKKLLWSMVAFWAGYVVQIIIAFLVVGAAINLGLSI